MRRKTLCAFIAAALAMSACGGDDGCLAEYETCEGACTDTMTNPLHCGECGNACGLGESCIDGVCDTVCDSGSTNCGGVCVDTDTSSAHCGECDSACPAGEVCTGGTCEVVCGGSTDTLCGDACIDLTRNPLHCGVCDNACAAGEVCSGGTCTLSCGGSTPTRCGDACVDTDTNPLHCGACDSACASGEVCDSGSCVLHCSTGLTDCTGSCLDLDTDPDHCGDCDTACADPANATGVCVSGACDIVCTGTYRDCNVDPGDGCELDVGADDLANCGACGAVCDTGLSSSPDCTAGVCSIVCGTDYTFCSTDFMDGCTDLLTDVLNCGTCGTACATEELCIAGSCVLPETCAQIVPLTTTDGPFTLYWGADSTKPWGAWCHDMAGTPLEYLIHSATATGQNFAQYTCGGGGASGTSVRTSYTRVRLDPATSLVNIGDQTFATSTGTCTQGSTVITSMPYGSAADCYTSYSTRGLANVDLTGTPFRVIDTWCGGGYLPGGGAVLSSGDQIVNVTGGGYCGWINPCPYIYGIYNTRGGARLDLEYIP